MITKELTPERLEYFAARSKNPASAAYIRAGMLKSITDTDGTIYERKNVLTRDLGDGTVTKAAPTSAVGVPVRRDASADLLAKVATNAGMPELARKAEQSRGIEKYERDREAEQRHKAIEAQRARDNQPTAGLLERVRRGMRGEE